MTSKGQNLGVLAVWLTWLHEATPVEGVAALEGWVVASPTAAKTP